jgi:hypothetical protein
MWMAVGREGRFETGDVCVCARVVPAFGVFLLLLVVADVTRCVTD